jgi:hypothetical protein
MVVLVTGLQPKLHILATDLDVKQEAVYRLTP